MSHGLRCSWQPVVLFCILPPPRLEFWVSPRGRWLSPLLSDCTSSASATLPVLNPLTRAVRDSGWPCCSPPFWLGFISTRVTGACCVQSHYWSGFYAPF